MEALFVWNDGHVDQRDITAAAPILFVHTRRGLRPETKPFREAVIFVRATQLRHTGLWVYEQDEVA